MNLKRLHGLGAVRWLAHLAIELSLSSWSKELGAMLEDAMALLEMFLDGSLCSEDDFVEVVQAAAAARDECQLSLVTLCWRLLSSQR